jgi:mono/diheme cytochrome c family protein
MILALLFACASKDTAHTGHEHTEAPTGGDPVAGEAIYSGTCAGCHGADGTLGTDIGGVQATDLTFSVPLTTDDNLKMIMRDGIGNMPPQLSDDTEIEDTLAYLRQQFP